VDHRSRSPRLKYCRLLYLVGNKFNVRRNLTDNSGYIKLLDPCILAVFEREFERIGGWALSSDSVGRQMIYCGGLTMYTNGILLTRMTFVYLLLLIINRKLGLSSFAHKPGNPLLDGSIKSRARQAVPWKWLADFCAVVQKPLLGFSHDSDLADLRPFSSTSLLLLRFGIKEESTFIECESGNSNVSVRRTIINLPASNCCPSPT
jgi:hypothetical protein